MVFQLGNCASGINSIFASKLALNGTGQLRLKYSGSWVTTEILTITS